MALKMGHSADIVSSNIKEMVKAGHKPKQAIASALAMKRKSKKMADGGVVVDDMDQGVSSDNDENANRGFYEIESMGQSHPSDVMNPEYQDRERMLAKALYEQSEKEEKNYAMGGLVQEGSDNKPGADLSGPSEVPMSDMPMESADLGHAMIEGVPMLAGLSEEAKKALEEKKKRRRFA